METIESPPVTELQLRQYNDVRCWLANLYNYALIERPHLKTEAGQAKIDELHTSIPSDVFISYVTLWHIWLTTYMLMFNQMGWVMVSKQQPDGIDFSTSRLPKIPDYILLGLSKHEIFEDKPFTYYTDALKLTSAEKNVLKTMAVRIS